METVNFKSNFHFVDKPTYYKLRKGVRIDFYHPKLELQKADEFYTESVRTCTAGILIDNENFEAVGFHRRDSKINFLNIMYFLDRVFKMVKNPTKAILIGGKNLESSPYSMEQFQRLEDIFKLRVDNVSVFKEHKNRYSETDFHYSLVNDRVDVHSMYRDLETIPYDVLSEEEIKNCFASTELSDGDIITFQKTLGDNLII